MPELPEVQTLAASLERRLRGRRVTSATMRSVAALKTYDPPLSALTGLSVAGCRRAGKFLLLELPPLCLVVHLGRAGWLRLRAQPTAAAPSQRGPLVMVLGFDDGAALEATEPGREHRFAVHLVHDPASVPGIARLGVDALDDALTAQRLQQLLRDRTTTLKAVLSDQSVIAGIGNAYSDEILHAARLSPFRPARSLGDDEVQRLHLALRQTLHDALVRSADLDVGSLRAEKRLRLRVHGRAGESCPVCGDTVRQVSFSTRSFQYCPTCQTGGRVYADRRLSRLLR